jgi:hypothetical protein
MAGIFGRIKQSLGYEPAPDPPQAVLLGQYQAEIGEVTTLTVQQRFWGFGISVLVTAVCWGLVRIPCLATREPNPLAFGFATFW